MSHIHYFCARHVAPMIGPVIENGVVAVEGDHVVAVGAARQINAPRIDHDIDGLLMPGLINAHTHLELTNVPRPPSPGTFQDWLLTTMGSMREADLATFNRKREDAVREGIAQCLKFGVTAVGDISQNVDIVRPILRESPIRAVSYGECLGLGPRRGRFAELLEKATASEPVLGKLVAGISPHAPYTVDAAGYVAAYDAMFSNLDIEWATHLAETPDEMEFIRERRGPFRRLYEHLGFNPGPADATTATTPIEWLHNLLKDSVGLQLVHVNYCTDGDLDLLAKMKATVIWCPRTHAYFGHPPHRWREMQARGITVCIGTDSCASSSDLNLVDDLRLVHRQSPDVPVATLWRMVTSNAAFRWVRENWMAHDSCGINDTYADFCIWPTRSDDPIREILETPNMLPTAVYIGGALSGPSPLGEVR